MSAGADALTVENLHIAYRVGGHDAKALRGLSFRIARGEAYGLVGESGCGKSTAALAVVRYLPHGGRKTAGRISIGDLDVYALERESLRHLRATTMSMVYQDPGRALNPSIRVGEQIAEVFRGRGVSKHEARDRAVDMLGRVRIADGRSVYDRYPHQLSGGMQQRVAIAMALSIDPKLLILDEPTTGLDATVAAEILDLVGQLRAELHMAILFISHDLAVIDRMCDRVGVLYAGVLAEEGPTREIFGDPRHPYTVGLLRCLPSDGRRKGHGRLDSIPGDPPPPEADIRGCAFAPRCRLAQPPCISDAPPLHDLGTRSSRCHYHSHAQSLPRTTPYDLAATAIDRVGPPLLRAESLSKTFGDGASRVGALHEVSLELWPGETLGLVGESGSGKSTLAQLLVGLAAPDPGGSLELDGAPLGRTIQSRTPDQLKSLQMVFQNPDSALNRAHSVRRLIVRSLTVLARIPRSQRMARLLALTRSVRLADRVLGLRPRQLSGGMKQRVSIARAFAGEPRIVVCDEPTSALDVSVQASILNLLAELQARHRMSYLFISHDLGTVRYLSDRIVVLYLGRVMEIGPAERVFSGPHHPYTKALLSAVPSLDDRRRQQIRLAGEMPSAIHRPSGCVFHTRCPRRLGAQCENEEPTLRSGAELGHQIRCHIPAADLGEP